MDVFRSEMVTEEPIVMALMARPSPSSTPERKTSRVIIQPPVSESTISPLSNGSAESVSTPLTDVPITILEEVETLVTTKPTSSVVVPSGTPTMSVSVFAPTVFVEESENITALTVGNHTIPSILEINETISIIAVIEKTNSSETPMVPTEKVSSDISVLNHTTTPEIPRSPPPRVKYRSSKRRKSSKVKESTGPSKAMEELHARNRSRVSLTTISSLGFDYRSYYRRNSFVPINISDPITGWISGSSQFIRYMNTVFIPNQKKNILNQNKLIVYAKRGTTGIAGQMSGMCDVLLLAILNKRVFQCWDNSHGS